MHTIDIDHLVLEPEEGLLLGNGDLSVSIYQRSGQIVWRFGKNEVWDRRLDLDACPRPAHIEEIRRGIMEEGWVTSSYVEGKGEAASGKVSDPKRMKELTDGYPAYARRPYPCPKPVGELVANLPVDQTGLRISQQLKIEDASVRIVCEWDAGLKITLTCVVPPTPNVLAVSWSVEGWTESVATGNRGPLWFGLTRWADPTIEEVSAHLVSHHRYAHLHRPAEAGVALPLAPPEICTIAGRQAIRQCFEPDLEFPDGYRYALVPFATGLRIEPVELLGCEDAWIHALGGDEVLSGEVVVAVPCSSDTGGLESGLAAAVSTIDDDLPAAVGSWQEDARREAAEFWSRSSVSLGDPVLDRTWYETLHARRCAYRHDTVAPGLALPSTVADYSLWHGDYHMNFNYQQCFYGDYPANQIDLGDSFFPGIQHLVDLGRRLARDYWACRGTFIQISAYPFPMADDPYGTGPLCRLAYMTGWVAGYYWTRYRYTLDEAWLREKGYPVIRDAALFYTDFLQKDDDGLYHAFPSPQGESQYTGRPEDYTDQPQVIRHARFTLEGAVRAAGVLGIDADLVDEWEEVLENLVVVDDLEALGLNEEEVRRFGCNPPEFISLDLDIPIPRPGDEPGYLAQVRTNHGWKSSFNVLPWFWMVHIRNNAFDAERQLDGIRDYISRWRMPNGMLRAMASSDHGFIGAYGEFMGITAPIMEMLLQSWDGVLRVFPTWPASLDGSFTTLRAEGAFLVSASFAGGRVRSLEIHSERGADCRLEAPWEEGARIEKDGEEVAATEQGGIVTFETSAGGVYRVWEG